MISGANSGIGLVTAMFLAKKGKALTNHMYKRFSEYFAYWAWVLRLMEVINVHSYCCRCDGTFGVSQ